MGGLKHFFGEFKEFALKGSVIDLAVGLIVGTAFNAIVQSLVKDIVMPPIGLILHRVDFSNLFVSLNGEHYQSVTAAQQAGAPTINYGIFLNNVISFLITAFAVFIIVHWMNKLRRRRDNKAAQEAPTTKECPFCFSSIPAKATRCPQCTSTLA